MRVGGGGGGGVGAFESLSFLKGVSSSQPDSANPNLVQTDSNRNGTSRLCPELQP